MSGNEEKVEITAGDVAKSISAMAAEIGKMVSAINSLPEKLKPVVQASKEIAQGVSAISEGSTDDEAARGRTYLQRQRNFFLRRRHPEVFRRGVEQNWNTREWAFQRASADEQHILANQQRADQAAKDAQAAKAARQVRDAQRKNEASARQRMNRHERELDMRAQGLSAGWLSPDDPELEILDIPAMRAVRRSWKAEQGPRRRAEQAERRAARDAERADADADKLARARYAARRAGLDDGEMNVPLRELKRRTQEARDAQADRNKQLRNDAKDQRDANAARLLDLQKQRAVKRGFITDEQAKGITSKIGLDEAVEKGSVYSPAWLRGLGKMFGAGGISQRMSVGELAGLNRGAIGGGLLAGAKGLWSLGYGNIAGGASGLGAAGGGLLGGGLGLAFGFAGGPIGLAAGYLGGRVIGQGLEGALGHAGDARDYRRLWLERAQLGGAYTAPTIGSNWNLGLTPTEQLQFEIAATRRSGAVGGSTGARLAGRAAAMFANLGQKPETAGDLYFMMRRGGRNRFGLGGGSIVDRLSEAVSGNMGLSRTDIFRRRQIVSPGEISERLDDLAPFMRDKFERSGSTLDLGQLYSRANMDDYGRVFGSFNAPSTATKMAGRLGENTLSSPLEIMEFLAFSGLKSGEVTPKALRDHLANFQKGITTPGGMQRFAQMISQGGGADENLASIQLSQLFKQQGLPYDLDNALTAIRGARGSTVTSSLGDLSRQAELDEAGAAFSTPAPSARASRVDSVRQQESDISFQSTDIGLRVGAVAAQLEKSKVTMDEAFSHLTRTLRLMAQIGSDVSGAASWASGN